MHLAEKPLEGRFSDEQKMQYTHKANDCGREWAEKNREAVWNEKSGRIS